MASYRVSRPQDLLALTHETISLISRRARDKNIELQLDVDESTPMYVFLVFFIERRGDWPFHGCLLRKEAALCSVEAAHASYAAHCTGLPLADALVWIDWQARRMHEIITFM
jgi:hypothetical protein